MHRIAPGAAGRVGYLHHIHPGIGSGVCLVVADVQLCCGDIIPLVGTSDAETGVEGYSVTETNLSVRTEDWCWGFFNYNNVSSGIKSVIIVPNDQGYSICSRG